MSVEPPVWLCWTVAALWLLRTLLAILNVRALPRLPQGSAQLPPGPPDTPVVPQVTVVIAARDEGARIEQTIRRLFEQRGVTLEVVAVDDRSSDSTGATLDRLARELPGLRVEHVRTLPERWLGKCHACWLGARGARGAWLLFIDADIWLAPDVLARALAEAARSDARHVALIPHQQPRGAWASAAGLAMQLGLSDFAAAANRGRGHIGVGAFNLVERRLYEEIGGYEALRLEVVDDIQLGRLVWKAGGRTRILYAGPDVEVDYAATCREFVRVVEKNAFAVYAYSVPRVLALVTLYALLLVVSLRAPLRGDLAGWACFAALLLPVVPTVMVARKQGVRARSAPLMPFAGSVMLYGVLRSMVLTLKRGGVRWRASFHPLPELRAAREALHRHGDALAAARNSGPTRPAAS